MIRIVCWFFGHTRDLYAIEVDHGLATAPCVRCRTKMQRVKNGAWIVAP